MLAYEHAQLRGEPPATQTIVSADTAKPAAYNAPDAVSFYLQPVPEGVWENKVTIRSTRWARMYAPGDVRRAGVADAASNGGRAINDHIAVADLALKAYERALEPKRLVMIEGGHFDPYVRKFKTASHAAIDWFHTHLG